MDGTDQCGCFRGYSRRFLYDSNGNLASLVNAARGAFGIANRGCPAVKHEKFHEPKPDRQIAELLRQD